MTTELGIREITRNFNVLDNYDYVEIKDKKTNVTKGLFVSSNYSDEVKKFLDKKIKLEKKEQVDELMQFAGIAKGETKNLTSQEIKRLKKEKYRE